MNKDFLFINIILIGIVISVICGLIGVGFYLGYNFQNDFEQKEVLQIKNGLLNVSAEFEKYKLNNSNTKEQCELRIEKYKLNNSNTKEQCELRIEKAQNEITINFLNRELQRLNKLKEKQ